MDDVGAYLSNLIHFHLIIMNTDDFNTHVKYQNLLNWKFLIQSFEFIKNIL